MADNPAGVQEQDAPVHEQDAPVHERDAPVPHPVAPVQEQDALVPHPVAPVQEQDALVPHPVAPVQEQDAPVLHPVLPVPVLRTAKRVINRMVLPLLTAVLLCGILVAELEPDYSLWMDKISQMDGNGWKSAIFVGIGDITALFMIYSPMDTIFEVLMQGSIGHRLLEPYVAALSNCFIWSMYGRYAGKNINFSVVIVNVAGVFFNTIYTYVFVRYGISVRLGLLRVAAGAVVTVAITGAVAVGGCYFDIYGCNKANIMGGSGAFLTSAMYFLPALQNLRNVQDMPLQSVVASAVNASVWSIYGYIINDLRMLFPNGLGVLLCCIQLLVCFCKKFCRPRVQDRQEEHPEEEQLLGNNGSAE